MHCVALYPQQRLPKEGEAMPRPREKEDCRLR